MTVTLLPLVSDSGRRLICPLNAPNPNNTKSARHKDFPNREHEVAGVRIQFGFTSQIVGFGCVKRTP